MRHEPTIVALQEVRTNHKNAFQVLLERLQMEHIFQIAEDETFGNALLWQRGLIENAKTKQNLLETDHAWPRSYCMVSGTVNDSPFSVCVTHLDHRLEPNRLEQLEILKKEFDKALPLVLVGDFNSLYRPDYTEEQIADIDRQRNVYGIEKPRFDVMAALTKEYQVFPAQFKPTCPYDTRVDYALVLRKPSAWEVKRAHITDIEVSDHAAVIVELRKKPITP